MIDVVSRTFYQMGSWSCRSLIEDRAFNRTDLWFASSIFVDQVALPFCFKILRKFVGKREPPMVIVLEEANP